MALQKKAAAKVKAAPAKKTAEKKKSAEIPAAKKAGDTKAASKKNTQLSIAPAKKAAVKKAPVKASTKTAAKPLLSANQTALLARLTQAVPQLDEECLEALVHSAENLAESCRQDLMLEEARSAAFQLLHGGSKKSTAAKTGKNKKGRADDASPIKTAIGMPAPLTVEVSEDKRFFHIVVDGKWKMLDLGELKILVRIASDKGPESALMTRMFTWLKRERSDVLNDLGISSAVSPILAELIAYLKKNFKVMA